jgi:tripartite-type tricarboxylate transporter receptor subunit TctC
MVQHQLAVTKRNFGDNGMKETMPLTRRQLLKIGSALSMTGINPAFSQQFPSRPIKIIVPASAGTSIDAMTRFFAEPLSKRLNTPVVVENRSGAGGLLGYNAAAKAAPDGYTLILTGIPLYLLPLFSEASVAPFDAIKDFSPVARVARVPLAMVVSADSPYQSMSDLIQAMKSKPGEVTYSSQGIGSTGHLCSVVLNDMSKTKGLHISYKESTAAVTDVVAGRVAFTCQSSTGVLPLVQAGKLRILAVTGAKRWDILPNVATVAEAGVSDFEVSSQLDFMAPAHTPEAIIKLISTHLIQIAQSSQFNDFCKKQVINPDPVDAKALIPAIAREAARWKKISQLARS